MPTEQNTFNYRYFLITRKFALLAGAAVLVAVAIVVMAIVPQVQASLTLWGELQKQQKLVEQLRKKADELSKVQSSVAFAQSDRVNQVLPSKKPLLELLTALNDAATTSRVTITEVSLAPGNIATDASTVAEATKKVSNTAKRKTTKSSRPTVNKAYESLDISMKVAGPLSAINQFFVQVEKTSPATILTAISLNKLTAAQLAVPGAAAASGSDQFSAEITVTTYYFTQSVTAALQTPLPPIADAEQKVLAELDSFTYPKVQAQLQVQGGGLENLFGSLQALPTLPGGLRPGSSPSPSPSPTAAGEVPSAELQSLLQSEVTSPASEPNAAETPGAATVTSPAPAAASTEQAI